MSAHLPFVLSLSKHTRQRPRMLFDKPVVAGLDLEIGAAEESSRASCRC